MLKVVSFSAARKRKHRRKRHYPQDWQQQARACKETAGWKCEWCKAEHGVTRRYSKKTGAEYIVYLHACHTSRYSKNPKLICLCCRCHAFFDAARRRAAEHAEIERLRLRVAREVCS
jgi:hypothetical protein